MRIHRLVCALFCLSVVSATLAQSPAAYRIDDVIPAPDVGDGGPATEALPAGPQRITFDADGCLYISEGRQHRVRKVDRNGIIHTIAGTGDAGFSGDNGPATQALLSFPRGLAIDAAGNVYIADSLNHRVRMISATTGVITTVAGTGVAGFPTAPELKKQSSTPA